MLETIKILSDSDLGKQLAEAVGWKTKQFTTDEIRNNFSYHSNQPVWYFKHDGEWMPCICITDDLNLSADAERFVIEKVGHKGYSFAIHRIAFWEATGMPYFSVIAMLDARTRAEALLWALQEKQ